VKPGPLAELAWVFLRLGCTAFGGPVAHLGHFRIELVERRGWVDDAHFGDLVALCQFLPGPASSQVVFGLGMQRAGWLGALVASLCFTLPSALLMIGCGYGVTILEGAEDAAGWIHGLKLAATAVVAQAVLSMGKKLCTDLPRWFICGATSAVLLTLPAGIPLAVVQLGVLTLSGVIGWWWFGRDGVTRTASEVLPPGVYPRAAAAALVAYVGLLVAAPLLVGWSGSRAVALFDAFYRSGALVFGGGHVVLPLLRAEIVPRGWLTTEQFLAGYGAAQALPGPLFAFAAYLGTAIDGGASRWLTGLGCLLGVFLPGWLLVAGSLPAWQRLRAAPAARAALAGTNASVVGLLLAALCNPMLSEGIQRPLDGLVLVIAFALLVYAKAPPWLVVLGASAAGPWLVAGTQ
jgi:chromate transporter